MVVVTTTSAAERYIVLRGTVQEVIDEMDSRNSRDLMEFHINVNTGDGEAWAIYRGFGPA